MNRVLKHMRSPASHRSSRDRQNCILKKLKLRRSLIFILINRSHRPGLTLVTHSKPTCISVTKNFWYHKCLVTHFQMKRILNRCTSYFECRMKIYDMDWVYESFQKIQKKNFDPLTSYLHKEFLLRCNPLSLAYFNVLIDQRVEYDGSMSSEDFWFCATAHGG